MRYFLAISYKGTAYFGWQSQPNVKAVQFFVERALTTLLQVPTAVVASGRTDTGVHALQQMVHFDSPFVLDIAVYLPKINVLLPFDIAANGLYAVHDEAHARFDATARSYEYRVITYKNPFLQHQSHLFRLPIHITNMNEAAGKLLHHKDFQAFTKTGSSNKDCICTVTSAAWIPTEVGYTFCITANRFLYGMVRALVGTLLDVGREKLSVADFEAIIQSKNRQKASASAPPEGLFLSVVRYPYI